MLWHATTSRGELLEAATKERPTKEWFGWVAGGRLEREEMVTAPNVAPGFSCMRLY